MQVQRDSTDTSSRNLPRSLISTTKQPNPRDSSRGGGSFYFPLKIEADPASIATLSNSVADCTMYTILVSIFGAGQVGASLSNHFKFYFYRFSYHHNSWNVLLLPL